MGELRRYVHEMKDQQKRMHLRPKAFGMHKKSCGNSRNTILVRGQATGSAFCPKRGASCIGGVRAHHYGQVQTFTRKNSSSNERSGGKARDLPRRVKMPVISDHH